MKVLGVDTTADDTCAAVVEDGKTILSNVVFSQSKLHEKFGGIVPQIASFEHLKNVLPSVEAALDQAGLHLRDIDLFAVGQSPDPALNYYFISLNSAKVFSLVFKKPLIGVDHMEGHIFANFVGHPDIAFPLVSLTVAGGHTILSFVTGFGCYEILGQTRDDAAGEAFDKVSRLLRLGYPGGPAIDKAAALGDSHKYSLPRPMIKDASLDFSFSGLKTAVWRLVKELKETPGSREEGHTCPPPFEGLRTPQGLERLAGGRLRELTSQEVSDVAASFRQAAVEVLVVKLFRAAALKSVTSVVLGGGVVANDLVRTLVSKRGKEEGLKVYFPPLKLCTDNAVGTAVAGCYKFINCGGDDLLTLKHYREKPLMNWNL